MKDGVLIMGYTGVGKSTLSVLLAEYNLIGVKAGPLDTIYECIDGNVKIKIRHKIFSEP